MLLLEQDSIRQGRVDDENVELDASNENGKYEVEVIWDSKVYAKESESGHLSGLYYLISWKKYPMKRASLNGLTPQKAHQLVP